MTDQEYKNIQCKITRLKVNVDMWHFAYDELLIKYKKLESDFYNMVSQLVEEQNRNNLLTKQISNLTFRQLSSKE